MNSFLEAASNLWQYIRERFDMRRYHLLRCLGIAMVGLWVPAFAADEAAPSPQPEIRPAPAVETPASSAPRLAYGVEDILKLSRAQISEEVIATYIQASGNTYNLHPDDIVHLHTQGVPDGIITLMLAQGRLTTEPTNPPAPVMQVAPVAAVAAAAPTLVQPAVDQPVFTPGQNAAEIAAACTPVVQEAPSTLYIIPYSGGCYRSTYTVFGNCYPSYCYTPVRSVRLGGHHFYSYRHR
jgi:hypothetical protein